MRLVPSTVLVLQPMDVDAWTDAQLGLSKSPMIPPVLQKELSRRLNGGEVWSWQEWILFKRVERACRARADYGITALQYDMAVRLEKTRVNAGEEETRAQRLVRLAASADVPFLVDWESLSADGWREDDLVQATEINGTVAHALEQLCDSESWGSNAWWDITPEGVVVAGRSREASTSRARIYDVSAFSCDSDDSSQLIDLIGEIIEPGDWINNGGTVNAAFKVSDHLVVVATTRVHFEIERLLDNLRDAVSAEPPLIRPHRPLGNPRAFRIESEYVTGLLDHLRLARSIPVESLRSAGPILDYGVTEDELNACDRGAFGLLDTLRRSSSQPHRQRAE